MGVKQYILYSESQLLNCLSLQNVNYIIAQLYMKYGYAVYRKYIQVNQHIDLLT